MALYCQLISPPSLTFKRLSPLNRSLVGSYSNIIARANRSVLKCIATTKMFDETIVRGSTNYPPSIWPRDSVQSLTSNHVDEKGNFRPCLKDDCRGILSMYEAAFLLKEGEIAIFDYFRNFTASYLKEYVKENKDQYLSTLVSHELELPRYWRLQRLEARWFIDVYETRPDMNSIVLELGKLDFNMVQATHQEDMKSASRKWKKWVLEIYLVVLHGIAGW
ncbi:hypothetical protein Pint_11397 [Pistacia integerrima]|uniref:Uncharacterized protein n=1 Tax=Pistacia integerrima TaxID=434235 RepID=A0ACC0XHT1_9ROSI|nr:hypothetical protein Pint_11397 [Pistacia integerrima]